MITINDALRITMKGFKYISIAFVTKLTNALEILLESFNHFNIINMRCRMYTNFINTNDFASSVIIKNYFASLGWLKRNELA